MAIDPFYEHYYETGIDITGEIDDSQEEECGCEESRFEQTRVTPEMASACAARALPFRQWTGNLNKLKGYVESAL